jgi:DNA-directed RNA polymerase subunit RPC12/RpoP
MSDLTTEAAPDEAWSYPPGEQVCAGCDKGAQVPDQSPEDLAQGVVWECPACGTRNLLGGAPAAVVPEGLVVECHECSRTFTSDSSEQPEGGVCPGCGATLAIPVGAAEQAVTAEGSAT